jgi:CheY-like chemotaxis protein
MAANLLVVDDDPFNRDLICKVLRQEGYKVVDACDGAIALEILQMLGKGKPRNTLADGF